MSAQSYSGRCNACFTVSKLQRVSNYIGACSCASCSPDVGARNAARVELRISCGINVGLSPGPVRHVRRVARAAGFRKRSCGWGFVEASSLVVSFGSLSSLACMQRAYLAGSAALAVGWQALGALT